MMTLCHMFAVHAAVVSNEGHKKTDGIFVHLELLLNQTLIDRHAVARGVLQTAVYLIN